MKIKIPFRCPICDGVGQVTGGFYNHVGSDTWYSTNVAEPCRQCNGSGIVFGEGEHDGIAYSISQAIQNAENIGLIDKEP